MKKGLIFILLLPVWVSACGPSPSNDLYRLQNDIDQVADSEDFKKFWDTLHFLKKYQSELSEEAFITARKQDVDNFLTVLGMSANNCHSMITEIAFKAKNEKVKNHFFNYASLYQKAAFF